MRVIVAVAGVSPTLVMSAQESKPAAVHPSDTIQVPEEAMVLDRLK